MDLDATLLIMATVSVLCDPKALLGEGPFYDESREELVWVDIEGKSINFLNVNTKTNRSIQLEDKVGAAIPCEDDDSKLIAVIGRSICLVDRESGLQTASYKVECIHLFMQVLCSHCHLLKMASPVIVLMMLNVIGRVDCGVEQLMVDQ